MLDLTPSQFAVLQDILANIEHATYNAIAKRLDRNINAIIKTIKILEKKGYVTLRPVHANVHPTDKATSGRS